MDRYFYSIELDETGEKLIHLSGNVYFRDSGDRVDDYQIAEWTFFYLSVKEAQQMLADDTFFDYVNEKVNYLDDITKEEAIRICSHYHCGDSGTELHISDITEHTPCGNYWF